MNNILITSIGSFSTRAVINSIRKISNCDVIGCDIYQPEWHNVSNFFNKVLVSPRVYYEDLYLNFVLTTCEQYKIKTIIPLTDVDVDFFNQYKSLFDSYNIIVTICDNYCLSIARDKQRLNDYSQSISLLSTIKTFNFKDLLNNERYPIIAKPKNGRSSEGVHILKNFHEVEILISNPENYLFQEIVNGKICTVDYVRSSQFKSDFCIPRLEHLRTKNGAGMTIEIINNQSLSEIASIIGTDLNINGAVNIEFILKNDEIYIIDLNPRFSAGIGFSLLTGYDFVSSHLNCFSNKDINPKIQFENFIAEKIMIEVINK